MNKVPLLRFKEFKGSWEEKRIAEVAKVTMGQSPDSNYYNEENIGLPLIQGNSDIKNRKTSPRVFTSGITKECEIDDIILSVRAPVGEVAKSFHNACIGRGVSSIRPNNKNDYLYHYLISKEQKWLRYAQGSTFKAIGSDDVRNFKVLIPSLPEQEKIAEFLSIVDSRIENQENKIDTLEKTKNGLTQKIFSHEIRFKDENGEEYPEWEYNELGKLSNIKTGKLDANAMVVGGKYRFYTCAKDYYNIDEFAFDTEALLISGNGANVGYIHYYKGKFNAYQRTYVLDGFEQNITYLKYYLERNLSKRIYKEKKDGNTPYIVMSTLSEMEIELPSQEEQQRIADFLSLFDDKIEIEKEILETLKEIKKGLLQQMFV